MKNQEEHENHKYETVCYICNKEFSVYDEDKEITTKLKIIVNLLVSTKVFAIRLVDQNVDH